MASPINVTFLTIMPSPYTLDLARAIEEDGRIAPTFLFMEMSAPDTHWGSVALPKSAALLSGSWQNFAGGRIHWNPGAIRSIQRTSPDLVVVSGYSSFTAQIVMRWLRWIKLPWIFWGEVPGMRQLSDWRCILRALAIHPAMKWPNAIAGIGSVAVDAYRRLAKPNMPVHNIPYHTDLRPFMNEPSRRDDHRIRILYCGQLIARKGVDLLLNSFISLSDEFPDLELVLVGEGDLRESLQNRVGTHLKSRVFFAGFQPIEKLPEYFSSADLFILPSRHDGWGVVVNQALGAGLPIICSSAVGSASDLVTPNWNGYVTSADDQNNLTESIRSLASNKLLRIYFGENSRQRASEWTPAEGAGKWVTLCKSVLQECQLRSGGPLRCSSTSSRQ